MLMQWQRGVFGRLCVFKLDFQLKSPYNRGKLRVKVNSKKENGVLGQFSYLNLPTVDIPLKALFENKKDLKKAYTIFRLANFSRY